MAFETKSVPEVIIKNKIKSTTLEKSEVTLAHFSSYLAAEFNLLATS